MSDWNSNQYLKYENERTQPSIDLTNRIRIDTPQKIIDVGCGPGNSTNVLARRFPGAHILGIDNSPNMIETAKGKYPALDFLLCDASRDLDTLDNDFDVVFSNACIQWIPNHYQLLKKMMERLKKEGVLAVQTPDTSDAPIHKILKEVSSSQRWASHFQFSQASHNNLTQGEYYDLLDDISSDFSMWRTTYFHTMKSHKDIIEWYRGTGLRPYLSVLSEDDKQTFEHDLHAELINVYPLQKNGDIIFRFSRLFFTAMA